MKILTLLMLLNIHMAYSKGLGEGGGDRVGNGGDVLLCQENGEDKYYVLDEYKSDIKFEVGDKDTHYSIGMSKLFNKIKKAFPVRYDAYINIYNNFKASITYTDSPLPEIDDENFYDFAGCEKIQAAYFKKNANGTYTYFLQKKIWNRLDNNQKAVLLFHEILYTEAIGLYTMTSNSVRGANRILFSKGELDSRAFDDKFLLPLKYTGTFGQYTDQLLGAFSESIAINLLERNWSLHYSDKSMIRKLRVLKERFSSNSLIALYVEDHISRIQALE